ncbi:MAG: AAA family ATPase [Candidatus Thalassarchaeaceae archaeon]|jgi:2-phosphoglycerate kinase|nr:AAA family ATPase [Candidatus Thalassarchaeaceae archaeon]MDP7003476.1 AAA family ATPase [Candidatus Thalassarchaeaceae archaeon]
MVGPRLLVITGTSGVGKSTLTAKLASSLGFCKVAATDTIREVLRTQFDVNQEPALHRSSFEPAGNGAIADWHATVAVLSEGVAAIIDRALGKEGDLLLEGVHFIPGPKVMESWRAAGGAACGVVLNVPDEGSHMEMILRREHHNGRAASHYLGNLGRIRTIQDEMVRNAEASGWIVIDVPADEDPIGRIEGGLV